MTNLLKIYYFNNYVYTFFNIWQENNYESLFGATSTKLLSAHWKYTDLTLHHDC